MDYSIWNILEDRACNRPHFSIQSLKQTLRSEWNKLDDELVEKCYDDWLKRLSKCMKERGHFE